MAMMTRNHQTIHASYRAERGLTALERGIDPMHSETVTRRSQHHRIVHHVLASFLFLTEHARVTDESVTTCGQAFIRSYDVGRDLVRS